jgi:hypothetical protein
MGWFQPPVTRYCPAGPKSDFQTSDLFSVSVHTHMPVIAFQMREVPSKDEVTTHRLSGEKEMDLILSLSVEKAVS